MFTNWKRLLLAVYRLEESQQEILAKLDAREPVKQNDSWVQSGIDSILSYSVNKKSEEEKA